MATTTDKYSTLTTGGLEVNNPTLGKTLYVNANGFVINGTYIDPLNLSAVSNNVTNTALNLSNSVIVQNTKLNPTKTITTQAGDPTQVGQIFGLNYYDASLNDLSIQTTAGQGGVVFKESGAGASANSAKIKQGTITSTNGTNTTTITPTSVTTTNFIGDLSGNAVTASNIATTGISAGSNYYIPFLASSTSSSSAVLYTDSAGHITFNPSTNQLSTDGKITCGNGLTMNGSASQLLINNASASVPAISAPNAQLVSLPSANVTATTFTGALAGTATNATNAVIGTDNASTLVYPTFVKTSGAGNKGLFIDDTTTPLTYNPSTGALTATSFVGNASSATLINITNTTTTAGTYYPTFVSTSSSNNVLRIDSLYLQYNPSTNVLQNPNFLVSDGTETSSTGGLLISTNGAGSKSIRAENNTGATNNTLNIQNVNTGNGNGGIYDQRNSGSGNGSGSGITALPSWNLSSSFITPTSPAGTPYSTGNYYMLGSCCNMATQLIPNGGENGVVVGFQNSVGDNNGFADMFYNNDQYSGTSPYILRLDGNGNLKYGIGTAGTYPFGTQNPTTFSSTYFSVDNTGVTTTNSVTLSNAPTTANQASRLGQVGLVKIGSVSVAVTGSSSAQNLSFANLFNSSYKNYRIILEPTTQVSFTQYPSYALQAFLGTGTLPTIASLYGFEMISSATSVVTPVYTSGATLSSAPLVFAVSSLTNKEVIFDIQNVGFANTASQQVSLMCKSLYGNPGVSGASDRTISCASLSGATITGLVIQQSILSAGNNFTLRAVVYGYNQL